jgi:hypothetical protein
MEKVKLIRLAATPDRGMLRRVKVNEKGRRIGEGHHRSKLTDHEVDLVRELRDEGFSYGWLAEKFEVGKSTIRDICICRCRAQICADVRIIRVVPDKVEP